MPAALALALTYIGVSAAVASTIVAFAILAAPYALLLGGLAYSSMKSRQAKSQARDAYNAAQVDRLVNITSATAPRDLCLGRVRKGGTIAYKASTGAYQKDLYLVIALAGHEIDAIEGYYLNDELVSIDGSGNVTSAPYATGATLTGTLNTGAGFTATLPATYVVGSISVTAFGWVSGSKFDTYRDRAIAWSQAGLVITAAETAATVHYQYSVSGSNVKITQHLGAAGQTVDAALLAAFPSDWSSANIGQGIAYVVAKLTYSEASFPSGAPNLTVVLRGAKLYDPRTGTAVWSENPALMMRHIYAHAKFGKATITAAEDVRFIAAANACDTGTTYTVGGVAQAAQALYKASLVLPYGAAAKDAFDDLAQAMGGSWAFAGGEIYLKAGVYTAPVMTLDDTDLAVVQRNGASESQKPIAISVHKERAQKYNTVKVKIWDQAQDYKQSELTPLVGSALVTRDGVELVQEVTYPAIGYAPQALHVAGIMMRDARDPLTVDLPFKLRAYPLELFDTVSMTLSRYGWAAKTFMILSRVWNADGTLSLTLKETSATITQMDAGFSAQGFAANTNLPKPWQIGTVGALTITSGTNELVKQVDGTVQSRMRVTWVQVTDISVQQAGQVEVQYRAAGSSGAWTSLVVPGDETTVATTEVQDYQSYIVRARCKTKLAVSDWTAQVLHQVIGKTAPPADTGLISYAIQSFGIQLSWVGVTDADLAGYEIRTGGSAWGTGDTVLATSSGAAYTWKIQTSGSITVRVKAIDTTGNYSTTASVATVTITAPSAPTITYAISGPDEYLTWTIPTSGFAVDRYEIRSGASWAAGVFVDTTKATGYKRKVDYSGAKTYWVAAIDAAGNVGTAGSVTANITAPGVVTALLAQVVDNNALIYWGAPVSGSLPVDRYEVRKGVSWVAGSVIGSNGNSTFTTVFEQQAGTYNYWIAAVDSAGTYGAAVSVAANINQPPDYVLRANLDSSFAGTKVNTLAYGTGLLLPVNTTETWTQHFVNNGYATPQAQITAGMPIYIEPGLTTASYTELIDYGATLSTTNISVTLNSTAVVGTVTASCQIQYSNTSGTGPWTSAPAGATSALASNFRWVQVIYTFTAAGGANLLQVTGLNIKLSIKQRSDSGSGTSAAGLSTVSSVSAYWVTVNFGYAFISADCPIIQPNSTTALIPIISYVGGVSPTGFQVAFVNTSGTNVASVPFSWSTKGY
jgi:hypothetical protein